MSKQWLESFEPNPDPLLNLLRSQIDDGMIREIAGADYGNDLEGHLRPLKEFRDEGVVPMLDWHPREVLELIRWSEPEDKDWSPGGYGRHGHLLRAFACSALLRSYEREENRDEDRWHSFNETAIQLADSLTALGDQYVAAGVRFLSWCVEHLAPLDEEGFEPPFLGLALLYLALKRQKTKDEAIISLCEWIEDSVSALLQQNAGGPRGSSIGSSPRTTTISRTVDGSRSGESSIDGRKLSRRAKRQLGLRASGAHYLRTTQASLSLANVRFPPIADISVVSAFDPKQTLQGAWLSSQKIYAGDL